MDGNPPDSSVYGILQARILESKWITASSSSSDGDTYVPDTVCAQAFVTWGTSGSVIALCFLQQEEFCFNPLLTAFSPSWAHLHFYGYYPEQRWDGNF